jgi:Tfp pilus assembly protein PilN
MNAVNLIPLERRRVAAPTLPGTPFLGLLAALVLALAATVLYVEERNSVSSRRSELAHLRTDAAQWSAAAARYLPAVDALKLRAKGFAQLGVLLGERYDWSILLSQLAGVMPQDAELTTLNASAATAASSAASTGSTTASGGTTTSGGTATSGSGITLSGCAVSQPAVADTMVALRRLTGVSVVSLLSSVRVASGTGGGTGAATGGPCTLPISFSLSLEFAPATALFQLPRTTVAPGAGSAHGSATAQLASSTDTTGASR